MFRPQKFEQREICEQPVQRETFLHSLDLIAHPWLRKSPKDKEIPSPSSNQHEVISPCFFIFHDGLNMCRWTNKLKIYSRISEIILEKKKRKRLSREFLFCPSLLQCRSVDLDASEYTLGLIFVTSPYGTSPASKLLTSYFWPPIIVVNIFFHFQIILTESFRGKIAPPGNFIKIFRT